MPSWVRHISFMRARLVIALVALFSLAVQSYLVQTHIHGESGTEITAPVTAGFGHSTPADKDNPDNCPICQAFTLAGAFLAPTLVVLATALAYVELAPNHAAEGIDLSLFRLSRQSRAPPRV